MTTNCPPEAKVVGKDCPQFLAILSFEEAPSACIITGDAAEMGEYGGGTLHNGARGVTQNRHWVHP